MRNLINFILKYDYWFLFIVLEIASFILLFRFNNYQGSVFFSSANYVSGVIYETSHQVTQYFGLRGVNEKLTARNIQLELEVENLSRQLVEYEKDTTAITRLRTEVLQNYRIVDAHVVNNSVTRANNFITLDKGSADGIQPEMGVVCGNGIVGIVYLTAPHHSIVLPVLNAKSNISCKINRTSYFGILNWDGNSSRYAYLKDLPRHSEFALGDTIVTSGHSSVFPVGIPVGTVDDMSDSHDGLSYLLKVRLFTDFARLNDVQVIAPLNYGEQAALEDSVKVLLNN
ncbi:MAG: rod shape-determining protein MreC [Bacteroides sp.]|nr:rod shape-determining protein MreC [Bacteroides sp.]